MQAVTHCDAHPQGSADEPQCICTTALLHRCMLQPPLSPAAATDLVGLFLGRLLNTAHNVTRLEVCQLHAAACSTHRLTAAPLCQDWADGRLAYDRYRSTYGVCFRCYTSRYALALLNQDTWRGIG